MKKTLRTQYKYIQSRRARGSKQSKKKNNLKITEQKQKEHMSRRFARRQWFITTKKHTQQQQLQFIYCDNTTGAMVAIVTSTIALRECNLIFEHHIYIIHYTRH